LRHFAVINKNITALFRFRSTFYCFCLLIHHRQFCSFVGLIPAPKLKGCIEAVEGRIFKSFAQLLKNMIF